MNTVLIKNALIINEGASYEGDLLIRNGRIEQISRNGISHTNATIVEAAGLWLIPGVIDDQVHFREPGLTHKATIASESAAAVAGGITSFMEMPNTIPHAVTVELLEQKYQIASACSPANYSFFMGTTNENIEEVLKVDPRKVCGVKIFMGSSTGNMLVDDPDTLGDLFSRCPLLIATHCEDEETIRENLRIYTARYHDNIQPAHHPLIRSREACLISSQFAYDLASKFNTRLHILHISTLDELALFRNDLPLREKRITAEVCVHHLTFSSEDYQKLGNLIKCNPAIKDPDDREALWEGLESDKLDIVATDHAPHTAEEKGQPYLKAPSGLPLVQHSLQIMLDHSRKGLISRERLVEKMCHAPADCFRITERGYLREGYFADLVLIDPARNYVVSPENILYKCGWSPFEGARFSSTIHSTWVNGVKVFGEGKLTGNQPGARLAFEGV